jgi:hypothetical protein
VKDEFIDPASPYIRAKELPVIARMKRSGRLLENARLVFPHFKMKYQPKQKVQRNHYRRQNSDCRVAAGFAEKRSH